MASYFLIENDGGDTIIYEYTREHTQKLLGFRPVSRYLDNLPSNNTNYWNGGVLLIKGEIVVPKPIQVVYEIP